MLRDPYLHREVCLPEVPGKVERNLLTPCGKSPELSFATKGASDVAVFRGLRLREAPTPAASEQKRVAQNLLRCTPCGISAVRMISQSVLASIQN